MASELDENAGVALYEDNEYGRGKTATINQDVLMSSYPSLYSKEDNMKASEKQSI